MQVSQGTGVVPYRGYEYQIVVSVWVALDLMLERRLCSSIDIEPASQEDIGAELLVPAELAETRLGVSIAEGPIRIQIKQRGTSWNEADFRALLKEAEKQGTRGPSPRERALAQLQADHKLRYLLITDAEIHTKRKRLVVQSVDDPSSAQNIDGLTTSAEVASRIAVMEKRLWRYVKRDIDDILRAGGPGARRARVRLPRRARRRGEVASP
ncbi:hypothetical protein [Sorangium sp. So ce1099]|uniref:hypothetical protein n=1 Tax=Sorangium sp. So ce1099 TaxID=3133331 RepID=UPI003F608D19